MSSLSLDDIANLLNDNSLRPKPKQIGPLRYNSVFGNCCKCGRTCGITVEGDYFCTTHALYKINQLVLPIVVADCTCDAGRKTSNNLHTADCSIYDRITDNAG